MYYISLKDFFMYLYCFPKEEPTRSKKTKRHKKVYKTSIIRIHSHKDTYTI